MIVIVTLFISSNADRNFMDDYVGKQQVASKEYNAKYSDLILLLLNCLHKFHVFHSMKWATGVCWLDTHLNLVEEVVNAVERKLGQYWCEKARKLV